MGKRVSFKFQSTFPLQGTTKKRTYFCKTAFISIHVPIAGNDGTSCVGQHDREISIHVPIAGNDRPGRALRLPEKISIHVPIAGNDDTVLIVVVIWSTFQSTFPLQGTTKKRTYFCKTAFISIHVPIAGNDGTSCVGQHDREISIHVPIAGNDRPGRALRLPEKISIHVPIAGNDDTVLIVVVIWSTFQSTFPLQGTTCLA